MYDKAEPYIRSIIKDTIEPIFKDFPDIAKSARLLTSSEVSYYLYRLMLNHRYAPYIYMNNTDTGEIAVARIRTDTKIDRINYAFKNIGVTVVIEAPIKDLLSLVVYGNIYSEKSIIHTELFDLKGCRHVWRSIGVSGSTMKLAMSSPVFFDVKDTFYSPISECIFCENSRRSVDSLTLLDYGYEDNEHGIYKCSNCNTLYSYDKKSHILDVLEPEYKIYKSKHVPATTNTSIVRNMPYFIVLMALLIFLYNVY